MEDFCGNCGAKMDLSISNKCPNCGTKNKASNCSGDATYRINNVFDIYRWIFFLIRGFIAIIGAIFLIMTGIPDPDLITFITILIISVAILSLPLALRAPEGRSHINIPVVVGILTLIIGITDRLYYPAYNPVFPPWVNLLMFILLPLLFLGLIDLSVAIFNPEYFNDKMLVGLSGILSLIACGYFFNVFNGISMQDFLLYIIMYGVLSIIIGLKVWRTQKKTLTE
jgi:hypothetical protein